MDCKDFLHRYSDYDDSLLSAVELASFQAHLEACEACARYDRVLRKGRMLARQLPAPEPGRDFVPRLQDRLHQLRADRRRRAGTPVLGGAAAALAAVTVVLSSLWAISAMEPGGAAAAGSERARALGATPADAPPAADDVRTFGGALPDVGANGRRSFPVAEAAPQRPWDARRVDQAVPVTYSPLVTGPPAYRVPDVVTAGAALSTVATPD